MICAGILVVMFCPDPPRPAPVVACPQLIQHDAEFQRRAADEFQRLPKEAALRVITAEWIKMRDQALECRSGEWSTSASGGAIRNGSRGSK